MKEYPELESMVNDLLSENNNNSNVLNQEAFESYNGERGTKNYGKSNVVSKDVQKSVDWTLPELLKTFAGNDQVISFTPLHPDDVQQANVEAQYIYNTIMNNGGYVALNSVFFDALVQRNGVVKVFLDTDVHVEKKHYDPMTDEELAIEAALYEINGAEVSIIKHDKKSSIIDITTYNDVLRIQPIAPDNFIIEGKQDSIDLSDCKFCAQIDYYTKSELKEMGYDVDSVKFEAGDVRRDDYRYWENQGNSIDGVIEKAEIAECYVRYDLDGDGFDELLKVIVVDHNKGKGNILDVEEVDSIPFFSCTPYIMPHTFHGQSIYDKINELQKQKTALLRNLMDNIYLQNNQRTVALENMVNLDDLLVSRPGGVVRVKQAGAVMPMPTVPIGDTVYNALGYLDNERQAHTGVSSNGSVSDNILDSNMGSQGVERVMTQQEELVGMIVRNIGETLIKPMCLHVHKLLRESNFKPEMFNNSGQWLEVNPIEWSKRDRITVKVGAGNGDKRQKQAFLMNLFGTAKELMMAGNQSFDTSTLYNILRDSASYAGINDINAYFPNPDGNDLQAQNAKLKQALVQKDQETQQIVQQVQQQAQQSIEAANAQATIKLANAEEQKAITQRQNTQYKAEAESAKLENQRIKDHYELQLKDGELKLKREVATENADIDDRNMRLKEDEFAFKVAGGAGESNTVE